MNPTRATTIIFSILLLLAGTAWVLLTHTPRLTFEKPKNLPEHRFTSLTIQMFDETGQPTYQLTSPKTYKIPNKDTHHLATPHILVTSPNQPVWTIESEEAMLTPATKTFRLQNNVRAQHAAYENQESGLFQTESLDYSAVTNTIETTHPITWDQGDNHLKAIGMAVALDTKNIILNQAIHATYVENNETSHLNAAHLTAELDEHNRLTHTHATGSPEEKAHFWRTEKNKKSAMHAYADNIAYNASKNQLTLTGDAKLTQNDNTLKAPHILYDTKTKHLLTTAKNNQKTVILINPENLPEKHL
jgi:LPS export ABC transporter protein LptC